MVKAAETVLGKVITVPKDIKARCSGCRRQLVTDGTEQVTAYRVGFFSGDLTRSNYVGWVIDCPFCDSMVEFDSRIRIDDWPMR